MNGASKLLEFRSVAKWYGSVAALLDVSFDLGIEVVGLVGRNGAGKSSLLKLAAGLLRPTHGDVLVDGSPAATAAAAAVTGYAPDFDRLPDAMSAVGFVASLLRLHGLPAADARTRAGDTLEQLGLGDRMSHPIRTFSKGMRQRVRLAQALAHRPRLLLLDEPMTGLDPLARDELGRLLRALPAQGTAVLVSSHVLHELEAIADRVVLVHQGRVLARGRIDELRASLPQRPHRVHLGCPSARELAAAIIADPGVGGVRFVDGGLEVEVAAEGDFYARLTRLAARLPGGVTEIRPLDDDLASVFGYLVG